MAGLLLVAAQLAIAQPLWLDESGRPGAAAREALGWLMQAESEGLRPADYQAAALAQALAAPPASPEAAARLDAAISAAVLRYLAELRHGRVAPAQIGARYDSASAPPPDLPVLLISGYQNIETIAPDIPRLSKPFRHKQLGASIASLLGEGELH